MIYFIAAETFAIKIGYSRNPVNRIKDIVKGQFYKAKTLLVIEGTIPEEQSVHKKFAHLQMIGEWFEYKEEILDYIKSRKKEHIHDYYTGVTRRHCPDSISYWAVEHPNKPFFNEAPRKTKIFNRIQALRGKKIHPGRGVYGKDVDYMNKCETSLCVNKSLKDKQTAKLIEILDRIEKAVAWTLNPIYFPQTTP